MRRIALDTNAYVSALQFGGNAEVILDMALNGEVEVAISQPILEETLRILRGKFGWTGAHLDGTASLLMSFAMMIAPTERLDVVPSDPDDNRIIECAVFAKSEFIVTGDKDLLRVGQHAGISVIRVREFLQREVAGNLEGAT